MNSENKESNLTAEDKLNIRQYLEELNEKEVKLTASTELAILKYLGEQLRRLFLFLGIPSFLFLLGGIFYLYHKLDEGINNAITLAKNSSSDAVQNISQIRDNFKNTSDQNLSDIKKTSSIVKGESDYVRTIYDTVKTDPKLETVQQADAFVKEIRSFPHLEEELKNGTTISSLDDRIKKLEKLPYLLADGNDQAASTSTSSNSSNTVVNPIGPLPVPAVPHAPAPPPNPPPIVQTQQTGSTH